MREAAAAAGGRVKFAYVVPDFANPTGETLSLAARERLLDLAAELDIPVIEDAAYAALRFEGEPLPPHPGARGRAPRQHRRRALDLLRHLLQGAVARPARRLDRGAASR